MLKKLENYNWEPHLLSVGLLSCSFFIGMKEENKRHCFDFVQAKEHDTNLKYLDSTLIASMVSLFSLYSTKWQ